MNDPASDLDDGVRYGNLDLIKDALDRGADINACGPDSFTAVQEAAWRKDEEVFQYLIECGADVNAVGREAISAAVLALTSCTKEDAVAGVEIFRAAVAAGASLPTDMEQLYALAWGAIEAHAFAKTGHEILPDLLTRGLDARYKEPQTQATLLHQAAACNDPSWALVLLQAGADMEARDHSGRRPLHMACFKSAEDTARLLMALHADRCGAVSTVEAIRQDLLRTPLECAILTRDPAVMMLSLERGPSPSSVEIEHASELAKDQGASDLLPLLQSWRARQEARVVLGELPRGIAP